jgi:ERCC4-related helicase
MAHKSVVSVQAHVQYLTDLSKQINTRLDICERFLAGEPVESSEKPVFVLIPAERKSDVSAIIFKTVADVPTVDNTAVIDRLHTRLSNLISPMVNENDGLTRIDFKQSSISQIAVTLNDHHAYLQRSVNGPLKSHLQFARNIRLLKCKYHANKRAMRSLGLTSFDKFVKKHLKFSTRYANKLVALAILVHKYPKLKRVCTSFNEMLKLHPKLVQMTQGYSVFWGEK